MQYKTIVELDILLSNSKWEIVKELSINPKSPVELAQVFKTSVANISQQLRLIEAFGIVGKRKIQNSEKGKPRTQYYIKTEILYILGIGKNRAYKEIIKPEPYNLFIFNTLSLTQKKDHFYLLKFFWQNTDLLIDSAIGIFKSNERQIELFVITENIENTRKRISNIDIEFTPNEKRKIICWSHNKNEITLGLKNKDPHFINLISESKIILDERNVFENIKQVVGN